MLVKCTRDLLPKSFRTFLKNEFLHAHRSSIDSMYLHFAFSSPEVSTAISNYEFHIPSNTPFLTLNHPRDLPNPEFQIFLPPIGLSHSTSLTQTPALTHGKT